MRLDVVHSPSPELTNLIRSAVNAALNTLSAKLDGLSQKVDQLIVKGESEEMQLTRIATAVHKNTDLAGSIQQTLSGVADQIRQNKADQDALDALATELEGDNSGLAAAIQANTSPPPPQPTA